MNEGLKKSLIEANFGKILYNVRFKEIVCNKSSFPEIYGLSHKPVASIKDIELYGTAICVAKNIKKHRWVFTEEGFLVCGGNAEQVEDLIVNILIDENIDVFTSNPYINGVKEGQSRCAEIHGLDIEVDGRPGHWCIFQ